MNQSYVTWLRHNCCIMQLDLGLAYNSRQPWNCSSKWGEAFIKTHRFSVCECYNGANEGGGLVSASGDGGALVLTSIFCAKMDCCVFSHSHDSYTWPMHMTYSIWPGSLVRHPLGSKKVLVRCCKYEWWSHAEHADDRVISRVNDRVILHMCMRLMLQIWKEVMRMIELRRRCKWSSHVAHVDTSHVENMNDRVRSNMRTIV